MIYYVLLWDVVRLFIMSLLTELYALLIGICLLIILMKWCDIWMMDTTQVIPNCIIWYFILSNIFFLMDDIENSGVFKLPPLYKSIFYSDSCRWSILYPCKEQFASLSINNNVLSGDINYFYSETLYTTSISSHIYEIWPFFFLYLFHFTQYRVPFCEMKSFLFLKKIVMFGDR